VVVLQVVVESEEQVACVEALEEVACWVQEILAGHPRNEHKNCVNHQVGLGVLQHALFLLKDIEEAIDFIEAQGLKTACQNEVGCDVMHPLVEGSTDPEFLLGRIECQVQAESCSAQLEDYRRLVFVDARLGNEQEEEEKDKYHVHDFPEGNKSENRLVVAEPYSLIAIRHPLIKEVIDQESLGGIKGACQEEVLKVLVGNDLVEVRLLKVDSELPRQLMR